MTKEFYEKTPSLSFRLRVVRPGEAQNTNSNILEWHSSLFELIRAWNHTALSKISNELEFSRISSNKVEQRRPELHG